MRFIIKTFSRQIAWFISKLVNIPVAVSGLASGVTGIGSICAMEYSPIFGYSASAVSACLLLLILIKKISYPKLFLKDLSHPVSGGFIPTFDMSLMVIAANISLVMYKLGLVLWSIAVIIHLLFFLSFLYYRLKDFNLNHMLPSWSVPPVGIVVAAVTGGFIHHPVFIQYIFYYGFSLYIFLLPIMIYRLIFGDKIPDINLPAFAIMAAPASLCLAGYLSAFPNPDIHLVNFLLPLALMMTSLVYISMFRINMFRIKFIPIYASFTFPLAIGANAVLKYANFIGRNNDFWWVWHSIGVFEMWVAIIVTCWVSISMLLLIFLLFYLKE